MKILRTVVLISTMLCAMLLWITKSDIFPSMSAFAFADNSIFYYAMHVSILMTFAIDGILKRRFWNWAVVVGVIFVIDYDMYNYPILHNVATGIVVAAAVFSIIFYAPSKKERVLAIVNCVVAVALFPLGLFSSDISLFFTESLTEFALSVAIARRIWIED